MNEPEHYQHFPSMKPWVGCRYNQPSEHKRLLVIGESHYLPKSSIIHLKSVGWYSANESQLTDEERGWISTGPIIANSKKDRFKIKSHGIYKSIAREANDAGAGHDDYIEAIEEVAFYNYFQRPAIQGASLRVELLDREVADGVFNWVVNELKPEMLVFASRKAGQECAERLRDCHIPHVVAPHPTCPSWNKACKTYGGVRGRDLVHNMLVEQKWYNLVAGSD